jgi:Uma2 family endonuclease
MATTISPAIQSRHSYPEEYLPESDGKPMAETDLHLELMIYLLTALKAYFHEDDRTYVTGNIFLYYLDEDGERQCVSPDVFVVRGVEKKSRRIYKMEDEGKAPDVVIELISASTKVEDLWTKRFIYAKLGVREYFLYDPYGETLHPALTGFRLEDGNYVPLLGARLISEVLGLELRAEEGALRLFDRKTGERLRSPEELEAEIIRLREELAKLQGAKS